MTKHVTYMDGENALKYMLKLEAQNKALWELVDNCLPYVQSFTSKKFENHAEAELILEAIQKAKVLAITPQQNESEEDGR